MCFTVFLSSSASSTGNLKASWVIDRLKLFWSVFWRDQHFWSTIQVIDLNMHCNCGWNPFSSFSRIVIPMEFPFTFFLWKKINHFFKKEVTSILSNAIIISQQWLSQDQITIIYLMTRSWEISSYTGLKCNADVDV